MTPIESENAAALDEIYSGDIADKGQQAESVTIDGVPVKGELSFDKDEIQLAGGGWKDNITGVHYTLKQYFPQGFPKPFSSILTCVIKGKTRQYQVQQLNGDKDNRAQLAIGIGDYANSK